MSAGMRSSAKSLAVEQHVDARHHAQLACVDEQRAGHGVLHEVEQLFGLGEFAHVVAAFDETRAQAGHGAGAESEDADRARQACRAYALFEQARIVIGVGAGGTNERISRR